MDRHRLVIHSANEIVCVTDGDHVLQGQKMNDIRIFRSKPDDLCALVVDRWAFIRFSCWDEVVFRSLSWYTHIRGDDLLQWRENFENWIWFWAQEDLWKLMWVSIWCQWEEYHSRYEKSTVMEVTQTPPCGKILNLVATPRSEILASRQPSYFRIFCRPCGWTQPYSVGWRSSSWIRYEVSRGLLHGHP